MLLPRINIVASDCMTDEDDLEKHILDDNYKEPLNSLFINLIPLDDKLYLLLGCDTRYDKYGEYKAIIEQFPTGDVPYAYHLSTIKGILIKCIIGVVHQSYTKIVHGKSSLMNTRI